MNKLALGRFSAAGLCAWAAVIWAHGGIRALREEKQHEIWETASRDPHSTVDGSAELANEVKAPAQGFGFNGIPER